LPTLSCSQWQLSEILSGVPEIWPETSEQFLPHYIGLPELGAVSFSKGCYIGQEIVARLQYRGQRIKYGLRLISIPRDITSVAPGENITDPNGTVVSSVLYKDTAYCLISAKI